MIGEQVADYDDADIIMFTGGADVSPELYGETPIEKTRTNKARDAYEVSLFQRMLKYPRNVIKRKAFVGICRGGQLLNVMNEGKLWQHVEEHGKDHTVYDYSSKSYVRVSSTHHQMMRAPKHVDAKYEVLCIAASRDYKPFTDTPKFFPKQSGGQQHDNMDIEAMWYPKTRSLCFQPHPEYPGYPECTRLFLTYVAKYIYPSLGFDPKGVNFPSVAPTSK